MGDPHARKSAALNRLRGQLRKKRESLADQFEFKMYILFHFKDKVTIARPNSPHFGVVVFLQFHVVFNVKLKEEVIW